MSPEQAARDMLSRMGVMLNRDEFIAYPWEMSADDVAELANLIAERDALKDAADAADRLMQKAHADHCAAEQKLATVTAERDIYYNRVASLLYSDELRGCKTDYIRKLATEYTDARAERDALRKDAERYRWLRERLSHQRCGPHVGWGTDTLLPGDDPDTAIDAARKEGEG